MDEHDTKATLVFLTADEKALLLLSSASLLSGGTVHPEKM